MRIVNKEELQVGDMTADLLERKPLPIGRTQFEEWSDRIIRGAMVEAESDSLKFALASMIMTMAPTEAFREDAYFILQLRKSAANQTAHAMMVELKERQKERETKTADDTAPNLRVADGILEGQKV